MPATVRPVTDGNDNIIGYDTFNRDGALIRRFNTEDEAIDFLVDREKPFTDPRTAKAEPAPEPAEADATAQDGTPA